MALRANRPWLYALLLVAQACTDDATVATSGDTSVINLSDLPQFDFGGVDGSDGSDGSDGPPGDGDGPDSGPTDEVIDPDIEDPDSLCFANPCITPPPLCDGDTLKLHTTPGTCIEPEAGGELTGPPECQYALSSTTDCGALGRRCSDELALCVDCLADTDCDDSERCDLATYACLPICTFDPFEENDSVETGATIAVPATVNGLHVCDTDSDYYAVPLPLGGDLFVTVSPAAGGELDVGLLRADGSVVSTATAKGGSYEVAAKGLPPGGYVIAVASSAFGLIVDYALSLTTLEDDPCVPNPCTSPPAAACEGEGIVTFAATGLCSIAGEGHDCSYAAALPVDCAPGFCLAGACSPYRQPETGELVVSEVMIAPDGVPAADGQWFEVRNAGSESLTLQGVTVTLTGAPATVGGESKTTFTQSSPLYVAPGGALLFGRNVDPKANGGVAVDRVYVGALLTVASSITLSVDATTLDVASWDATYAHLPARSLMLSPALSTAEDNDLVTSWCASALGYGPGGAGSPGKKNDPCPYGIERCRVTAPTSATLSVGASFEVTSEVHAPGLTDTSSQLNLHPLLRSEAGYGPVGSSPETWSTWVPQKGVAGSNDTEDEYAITLTAPVGGHDVAARFSGDAGTTWTYCDRDVGSGRDGSEDGYASGNAGKVTVLPDPCEPNPCVTPPDACEAGLLRVYPADSGACIIDSGTVQCAFAPSFIEDCGAVGKICDPSALECRGCTSDAECGAPFGTCDGSATCTNLCLDDDAEPDDTAETGPLVAMPFESERVLCAGDDDFRRVAVAPGDLVTLSVTRLKGDPVLVEVIDGKGAGVVGFIVDSTTVTQGLSIPESAVSPVWVVSVRGLLAASNAVYSLSLSAADDPCAPSPCASPRTACQGDEQVVYASDDCTSDAGVANCDGPETARIDCPDFCNDGACTPWRRPGSGELLITEVASEGRGNYLEVINFTDATLNLDGVTLEGPSGPMALVTGTTLVPPGSTIVFTDPASEALMAGPTIVAPGLAVPLSGTLRLSAFGLLLDQATVDAGDEPGAIGLDPAVLPSSTANDLPAAFCAQRTTWAGGIGTPNDANDACALAITFCRTQFPIQVSAYPGETATIYARWYNALLTTQTLGTDLDPEDRVRAEMGLAPVGSGEQEVVTWFPMEPNTLYDGLTSASPEPNNDEWMGTLSAPSAPGDVAVIVRFSGDGGQSWTLCDLDAGSSDGWSASSTTLLTTASCPNDLLEPSSLAAPADWPRDAGGMVEPALLTVCDDDTDSLAFSLSSGETASLTATATVGSGTVAIRRNGELERVLLLDAPAAGSYLTNAAGSYVVSLEHDAKVASVAFALTVNNSTVP